MLTFNDTPALSSPSKPRRVFSQAVQKTNLTNRINLTELNSDIPVNKDQWCDEWTSGDETGVSDAYNQRESSFAVVNL